LGTLSPSGRKRSETLSLLGYFLNPVTLKFDFTGEPTFVELVRQARQVTGEAICNDDVPIEHVARHLKSENTSPSPFFRSAISLQPTTPDLSLDWTVSSMDVQSGGSPWELYIAFIDRPTGLIGRAQFDPELFSDQDIDHLVREFEGLLQHAVASPQNSLTPQFTANGN
jgi:Condensation domain